MQKINMTRSALLEALKNRIVSCTADMKYPCQPQKGDTEIIYRAPEVYKMRLSNSSHAKKLAPYVILQFVNGIDVQKTGRWEDSTANVRIICVVYDDNEEEGAAMLLNLMDALRLDLLQNPIVGNAFKLDTEAGLESLVYIDDTAPFYGGEMFGTFYCPPIRRGDPTLAVRC